MSRLSLLLLLSALSGTFAATCVNVFGYERAGGLVYGVLHVAPPSYYVYGQDFKVTVELVIGASLATFQGSPMGVSPVGTLNSAADKLRANQAVRYRVQFPLQSPLSQIKSVKVNERDICSENPDVGGTRTTLTLSHTLLVSQTTTRRIGAEIGDADYYQAPDHLRNNRLSSQRSSYESSHQSSGGSSQRISHGSSHESSHRSSQQSSQRSSGGSSSTYGSSQQSSGGSSSTYGSSQRSSGGSSQRSSSGSSHEASHRSSQRSSGGSSYETTQRSSGGSSLEASLRSSQQLSSQRSSGGSSSYGSSQRSSGGSSSSQQSSQRRSGGSSYETTQRSSGGSSLEASLRSSQQSSQRSSGGSSSTYGTSQRSSGGSSSTYGSSQRSSGGSSSYGTSHRSSHGSSQHGVLQTGACASFFHLENRGGVAVGVVLAPSPADRNPSDTFHMKVRFYVSASISGSTGSLSLQDGLTSVADGLRAGSSRAVRYIVRLPSQTITPRVISLEVNGEEVCSEEPSYERPYTTYYLSHTVFPG